VSFRTALKFPFAIIGDPAWAMAADDMGGPRVTCTGSFARRLLGNESLCQLELKNSLPAAMHRFIAMRKTMPSV
jgi:hypothetical protein